MAKMTTSVGDTSSENRRPPMPGWYHLMVTGFDPYPSKKDGTPLNGWKVSCGICDGPPSPAGECKFKGKDIDLMFFHPTKGPDSFPKKKQDRLLVCLGLVPPDNQREDREYEWDSDDAKGRQFLAKFVESTYNEKTSIEISFLDFYHVDDPDAAACPRDEAWIAKIPAELRWDVKSVASKARKEATEYSEPTKPSGNGKPPADFSSI